MQLNLSDSAYGKLERGETKYDIDRLRQIATVLGTSIADLIDGNVFYNVENISNSPVALNYSTNTFPDLQALNDLVKTTQQLPTIFEKQNQLMQQMITLIEKLYKKN